jgi:hypothetical protein
MHIRWTAKHVSLYVCRLYYIRYIIYLVQWTWPPLVRDEESRNNRRTSLQLKDNLFVPINTSFKQRCILRFIIFEGNPRTMLRYVKSGFNQTVKLTIQKKSSIISFNVYVILIFNPLYAKYKFIHSTPIQRLERNGDAISCESLCRLYRRSFGIREFPFLYWENTKCFFQNFKVT